jgi:hypothetical protein
MDGENGEKRSESYIIESSMNDHGATTVRARRTSATYHVVEYASPSLRAYVSELSPGTAVDLTLSRAGSRANVWRADTPGAEGPAGAESVAPNDGRRLISNRTE